MSDRSRLTNDGLRHRMLRTLFGEEVEVMIQKQLSESSDRSLDATIRNELHRKHSLWDDRLLNVSAAIMPTSLKSMTWPDWVCRALNRLHEQAEQARAAQAYIKWLLNGRAIHATVTVPISVENYEGVISIYMEAIILICLLYPTDWQRLESIVHRWREWAINHEQQSLAERCSSCVESESSRPSGRAVTWEESAPVHMHDYKLTSHSITSNDPSRQMLETLLGEEVDAPIQYEPGSPSRSLLARWLGIVDAGILATISKSMTWTDWATIALGRLQGQAKGAQTAQAYVKWLLRAGAVHAAATVLLYVEDHEGAISIYMSHKEFKQASILVGLVDPADWRRLAAIACEWATGKSLTEICFSCVGSKSSRPSLGGRVVMWEESAPVHMHDYKMTEPDDSYLTKSDHFYRWMLKDFLGEEVDAPIQYEPESPNRSLLARWLRIVDADILATISESMTPSNWMFLALSRLREQAEHARVVQAYVKWLLRAGAVHAAATVLLYVEDHEGAISIYMSHKEFKEAIILINLVYPADLRRLAAMVRKWSEWAAGHDQQSPLAERCSSCARSKCPKPSLSGRPATPNDSASDYSGSPVTPTVSASEYSKISSRSSGTLAASVVSETAYKGLWKSAGARLEKVVLRLRGWFRKRPSHDE